MGFTDIRVFPLKDSPVRGLSISFTFEHPRNEIPLNIQGEIHSEDDKFLATLYPRTSWKDSIEGSGHGQIEIPVYSGNRYDLSDKTRLFYQMSSVFDQRTVEYIESVRQKNKKKDVVLILRLTATSLEPDLRVMNNVYISSFKSPAVKFPAFADTEIPYDKRLNLMVTPIGRMEIKLYSSGGLRLTISASDWVSDYQELLGLGKHIIIESPIPELESVEVSANISDDNQRLANRLKKSYELIKDMNRKYDQGEWGEVVEGSVKLFEVLKKDNIDTIKQLISMSTGLSKEKAQSLTEALTRLYGYSADLHHLVDDATKGVKTPFTGDKEDAQLIYLLSISLVNLLSQKIRKSIVHIRGETLL